MGMCTNLKKPAKQRDSSKSQQNAGVLSLCDASMSLEPHPERERRETNHRQLEKKTRVLGRIQVRRGKA
jgi:hypothetical protein